MDAFNVIGTINFLNAEGLLNDLDSKLCISRVCLRNDDVAFDPLCLAIAVSNLPAVIKLNELTKPLEDLQMFDMEKRILAPLLLAAINNNFEVRGGFAEMHEISMSMSTKWLF